MNGAVMPPDPPQRPGAPRERAVPPWPVRWIRGSLAAMGRGLALAGLALAGLVPLAGLLLVINRLLHLGGGGATPATLIGALLICAAGLLVARGQAKLTRRLAGQWCRTAIVAPYRPSPGRQVRGAGRRARAGARWLLTDPATWRDLAWAAVNLCGGWLLALLPAVLAIGGALVLIRYGLGFISLGRHGGPAFLVPDAGIPPQSDSVHARALVAGIGGIVLGLWIAPYTLVAYGRLAGLLLGPTKQAQLSLQVRHLAQTRSDSIDAGAAEMRRIERDLHDGAQARLVAMGMTLNTAEQLIDTNPGAAKALLAEARTSSASALAELRNLVRGIHPPVLADRGLAEAVRALALDSPVRAHVAGSLPARPPAPVESAAYFAVSELLANVSKHAGAGQVWIDIRHERGLLRLGVTDDGCGGANPARGTGLSGIERRIAAFDGVLAVSSPPGGPTVVNMEIPCELC